MRNNEGIVALLSWVFRGADMKVLELGHIVLYVRNLTRSVGFYRDVLGFEEIGGIWGTAMALRGSAHRTHHELLLIEVGEQAEPIPRGPRVGMYHFGLKVGDTIEELREARDALNAAGARVVGASDHTITKSLYIEDPDGNEIELYIDAMDWREHPEAVLSPIKPLSL